MRAHPHLANINFMYCSQVYPEKPSDRLFSTPMAAATWPGLPGGPYAIRSCSLKIQADKARINLGVTLGG